MARLSTTPVRPGKGLKTQPAPKILKKHQFPKAMVRAASRAGGVKRFGR